MAEFFSTDNGVLRVRIRLTPAARSEQFSDLYLDEQGLAHLQASVRAAPENGKANAALVKLLAGKLGIAKTSITLVRGETSRLKQLELPYSAEAENGLRELARS